MKALVTQFVLITTAFLPALGNAAALPMVDFVPQSIAFQKALDDDVSGAMSQRVSLMIKNVGTTASRYPGAVMRVLLNGAVVNANVMVPTASADTI